MFTFPKNEKSSFPWLSGIVGMSRTSSNHYSWFWSHQIMQIRSRKYKFDFQDFCILKRPNYSSENLIRRVPNNHGDSSHLFLKILSMGSMYWKHEMDILRFPIHWKEANYYLQEAWNGHSRFLQFNWRSPQQDLNKNTKLSFIILQTTPSAASTF